MVPATTDPLLEGAPLGTGFLAELCVAWEQGGLTGATGGGARVVCLRLGMVSEKDGGTLPKRLPPFRAFVGGPVGPNGCPGSTERTLST